MQRLIEQKKNLKKKNMQSCQLKLTETQINGGHCCKVFLIIMKCKEEYHL